MRKFRLIEKYRDFDGIHGSVRFGLYDTLESARKSAEQALYGSTFQVKIQEVEYPGQFQDGDFVRLVEIVEKEK